MRRFELTNELLTGFEEIDRQHRALIELGNRVVEPAAIKTDVPVFADAIRFLSDYVMYHFAAEEQVMIDAQFPHYEPHRRWHDRFKDEIAACAVQAAAGGFPKDLKLKISFAVENWMTEHISITDRALSAYLNQRVECADVHLPTVGTLVQKGKLPKTFVEREVWARLVE